MPVPVPSVVWDKVMLTERRQGVGGSVCLGLRSCMELWNWMFWFGVDVCFSDRFTLRLFTKWFLLEMERAQRNSMDVWGRLEWWGVMHVVRKVVDLGPRLPADLSVRNPYYLFYRMLIMFRGKWCQDDMFSLDVHESSSINSGSSLVDGLIHQPPPTLRDVCTLGMGEVCTIVPTNCWGCKVSTAVLGLLDATRSTDGWFAITDTASRTQRNECVWDFFLPQTPKRLIPKYKNWKCVNTAFRDI